MARTSRPLHIFPITLRELSVAEVRDLSPCMRRITLVGPQLQAWTTPDGLEMPAFTSLGFDDHVKLVIPDPAEPDTFLGTQEATRFAWAPEVLRRTRDYTVRSWEAGTGRLVIDLVRHDGGLAAEWAASATVGSTLHLAGPKTSAEVLAEADWYLLVGDETALPAIARFLEEAPAGTRAHVFIEVPHEADKQQLDTRAEAEISWLVRGDDHRAGHSPLLARAVEQFQPPAGRGHAWVAGETMTIKPIRQHLRSLLPAQDVDVDGYWRRVEATAEDAQAPIDVLLAVHEELELGPALVLRSAATVGVFAALADRPLGLAELAEAISIPAQRLRPLLDALLAQGYCRLDGEAYANTAKGEVLTDEHADEATLDHPHTRDELSLLDLVDHLRTGRPTHRTADEPEHVRAERLDHDEEHLPYVLGPLAELPELAAAEVVGVVGASAVTVGAALAAARGGRVVHCLVEPRDHARSTAQLVGLPEPVRRRVGLAQLGAGTLPEVDTWVLSGQVNGRDDASLVALLERVCAAADRVVLMTRSANEATTDDHTAVAALVDMVTTGVPTRTTAQVEALAARFGTTRAVPLGWGFALDVVCLDVSDVAQDDVSDVAAAGEPAA